MQQLHGVPIKMLYSLATWRMGKYSGSPWFEDAVQDSLLWMLTHDKPEGKRTVSWFLSLVWGRSYMFKSKTQMTKYGEKPVNYEFSTVKFSRIVSEHNLDEDNTEEDVLNEVLGSAIRIENEWHCIPEMLLFVQPYLNDTEYAVLHGLVYGYSGKELAKQLDVSPQRVTQIKQQMLTKVRNIG